jgi:hypothetical protein
MANEQVSIRLTTQGGEQILRVLEQIGAAAQTQFRKAATEARGKSAVLRFKQLSIAHAEPALLAWFRRACVSEFNIGAVAETN